MKKLIFAIGLGLVFSVQADYIYWMVDSPTVSVTQFDSTKKDVTWDNAVLSYDGTRIGSMDTSTWEGLDDVGAYAYASYTPNISPVSSDSSIFMIELYNGSTWLGKTEATASALQKYIFSNNSMSVPPSTAFGMAAAGSTYAVPEPTSGLLFLIGGMLLGLRRRRQQV